MNNTTFFFLFFFSPAEDMIIAQPDDTDLVSSSIHRTWPIFGQTHTIAPLQNNAVSNTQRIVRAESALESGTGTAVKFQGCLSATLAAGSLLQDRVILPTLTRQCHQRKAGSIRSRIVQFSPHFHVSYHIKAGSLTQDHVILPTFPRQCHHRKASSLLQDRGILPTFPRQCYHRKEGFL